MTIVDRLLRRDCSTRGVTLVEMMVVVALVAAVVALAGPSIRELLAVQRLRSIHAALVTDLHYARSEAVRRKQSLIFAVSGDDTQSCYIVFREAFAAGDCDCLRPPGAACTGASEEIRSVRFSKASHAMLAASSSQQARATFERDTGYSAPGDLRIDLQGAVRGTVRVTINATGRISSCSPDGSFTQVPRC